MKSKNIAAFGCSWTQGVQPEIFTNWVMYLSELYPQYNFYNFGASGTSITYHTHLLEQVIKSKKFDATIFQVTSPGRFTWWKTHTVEDILYQKNDNYYCLDGNLSRFVDRINTGTIHSKKFLKSDRKKHKFGVEYYKRLNDEQINLDYRTYINYIKQQVDFYFHHQSSLDSNVPSVITELGEKQFYKYVIDDGDHFGIEGSKWQANWIKDQLNSKGIL